MAAVLLACGIVDLGITWWRFTPEIRALGSTPPGLTNQMRRYGATAPPDWTPLASIPGLVVCAVLVAEDPRFLEYRGVDWRAQLLIARRVLGGDLSRGGSGIAQQLARNLYLSPARTPRRKVREWLLAINIGRTLTPDRQLEVYLNVAQWGPSAWGVAAGARELLDRRLDSLTPSEAVLLAVALPAPTRGLTYALHPARWGRFRQLPQRLWDRGVVDAVSAGATSARLQLLSAAVTRGASFEEARTVAESVMGEELPWQGPAMPELGCESGVRSSS